MNDNCSEDHPWFCDIHERWLSCNDKCPECETSFGNVYIPDVVTPGIMGSGWQR